MANVGMIEAFSSAIGESDNDIGGFRTTRLTSAVSAGATSLPVESTLDWAASGKIGVDGQVYSYASKTITTLDGITHVVNGDTFTGSFKDHRSESDVIDINKDFSAIDSLRRAILVDFAEADDLNALGRNLGVFRLPFVANDTVFRNIVKALAYNPRGTLYGMELALDAMIGAGNYKIVENLIETPNTVFISLLGQAALNEISQGKFFASGDASSLTTANDTVVANVPSLISVGGVRWKNENHVTDTTTAKPSAEIITEYVGDPGTTVWTYLGASELDVAVVSGQYIEFTDPVGSSADYRHTMRIQPESFALLEIIMAVPSSATISGTATHALQWAGVIQDQNKTISWGILANGPDYDIGLTTGAGFISGAAATLQVDDWHTITIEKNGTIDVVLKIDGVVVQTVPYSSFIATTSHTVTFGTFIGAISGMVGRVKSVGYFATTVTNYLSARGIALEAAFGAVDNQVQIDAPGIFQTPTDEGKGFLITGSAVTNAMGGNNNGDWFLETGGFVDVRTWTVEGKSKTNGVVSAGGPNMKAFGSPNEFQFPDDLGKKIVISGTTANDGTYYISSMFQEGSTFTTDLGAFATILPEKTSEIALSTTFPAVTPATLAVDTGMSWQIQPNFTSETNLPWELENAGSVVGVTITLRQDLPITTGGYVRVLDVFYSDVLSGQTLEDATISNFAFSEVPLLFEYYPIYVSDPLGFVRTYIDDITAAGVIPEFAGF